MTRKELIYRILRQVYGGYPTDDSEITVNLVNNWLQDATAIAAKTNYTDSVKLDGVTYVNNSFYSTFSNLTISNDDTYNLAYKIELPEIPVGLGKNDGVSQLRIKDGNRFISQNCIPLSANQAAYFERLKPIPNKVIFIPEGSFLRIKSTLPLYLYTGLVKMVSAGSSIDLSATINIPSDYYPVMVEYIKQQLMQERMAPKDMANDGAENT